jgi:protein SCO1/2
MASALAALVSLVVVRGMAGAPPGVPPQLGAIPRFSMLDQTGATVGDRELRGRAFVADFFYSSCTTSCPRLTAQMATLYHEAEATRLPLHFVSITLDPINDTPEVLSAYAARFGVPASRWSFLSGRDEDLNRVVVEGFKLHFQRAAPNAGVSTIMHGEWLVLVDPQGQIRGYYQASDAEHRKELLQDATTLVR